MTHWGTQICPHDVSVSCIHDAFFPLTPTPPPNAGTQTHANTSNLIFIVSAHTSLHEYLVLWLFCVIARCFDIYQEKNWVHTPQTSPPRSPFRIALRDRQRCARLSVSTCCRCGDLMGTDTPTRILPSCSKTNLMWTPCTTDSSFKNLLSCFGEF